MVGDTELGRRTMSKVGMRLMPFMIAAFVINFLDRVNIGFAALDMTRDLGLSHQQFGLAAGIFFAGYALLEIPSNIGLQKFGARVWLARIMITWGVCAMANAFVVGPTSLYAMRSLLGLAEAGFYPGLMLYLIHWFPDEYRGTAVTVFMIGNPLAVVIGAPISTAILGFKGVLGLAGWQWLFVLEGVPAVLLGVVTYVWLTERPTEAKWLSSEERSWLVTRLAQEEARHDRPDLARMSDAFRTSGTWLLGLVKFSVLFGFFGLTLWLPQILEGMTHASTMEIGFLSAIPSVFATIGSIVIGRHSDRTGERRLHIVIPLVIGATAFCAAAAIRNPLLAIIAITIANTGLWVGNTVFWTLPASLLAGTQAAATGIALVNSIGNLGGFFGPYLTGWVRSISPGFAGAMLAYAAFLIVASVLVMLLDFSRNPKPQPRRT
jgi:ACS family tartrate transporter-like MFS transporter